MYILFKQWYPSSWGIWKERHRRKNCCCWMGKKDEKTLFRYDILLCLLSDVFHLFCLQSCELLRISTNNFHEKYAVYWPHCKTLLGPRLRVLSLALPGAFVLCSVVRHVTLTLVVCMGTAELLAATWPNAGGNLQWTSIAVRDSRKSLLVTSCYGN